MADTRISALPASAGLADDDLIAVVDDPAGKPETEKLTAAQLAAYIAATVGDAGVATPSGELTTTTIRGQLDELDVRTRAAAFIDRAETRMDFVENFGGVGVAANVIGQLGWNAAASGAGAGITHLFGVGHYREASTGTTATGSASLNLGVAMISGAPVFDVMFIAELPDLSTAGEEFIARVGMHDATSGAVTDGMYFEYNRLVSVNWRFAAADGGSIDINTSSIAVTEDTPTVLRIVCDGSAVAFYVDGAPAGTITTTSLLPDVNTDFYGINWQIIKSAGTTARALRCRRFAGTIVD